MNTVSIYFGVHVCFRLAQSVSQHVYARAESRCVKIFPMHSIMLGLVAFAHLRKLCRRFELFDMAK